MPVGTGVGSGGVGVGVAASQVGKKVPVPILAVCERVTLVPGRK